MPKRFSLTLSSLACVVILCLVQLGCSSCTSGRRGNAQPPAPKSCVVTDSAIVTSSKPGSGAIIVTDVSGSMNGFALPNSTRLFTLHDELDRAVRNAIATSEASPTIQRCYLGATVDCQSNISPRDFDKASLYSAKESRLDLFFAPTKDTSVASNKTAVDPIDPYHVAVLITDGMEASAPNSKEAAPCLAGADPACMAYLLKQRAESGYGIWATLILMPFKGTHYAERPLDDSHWQRIQQHIVALTQDPYFLGVKFTAKRAGNSVPFSSYQFEGSKPVLVLVVSRDIQAGRAVVKAFSESLQRERIVQPANAVYTMELAPLSVTTQKIEGIRFTHSVPVTELSLISNRRDKGFFNWKVQCNRDGKATFDVVAAATGGENIIPDGVHAGFELGRFFPGGVPEDNLKIGKTQDNNFQLQVNCGHLVPGEFKTCLSLQARLTADANGSAFWNALSSDNMYEAPERLYGLKDMILQVLNSTTEKPRVTDAIMFTLELK